MIIIILFFIFCVVICVCVLLAPLMQGVYRLLTLGFCACYTACALRVFALQTRSIACDEELFGGGGGGEHPQQ